MQTGLAATLDGAGLKFAQIVSRSFAEQPDQERTIAGKPARIEIGTIVELLDGLEDPGARVRPDPGLVVDDPRHRFRRDLGEVCDLLNGDGCRCKSDGQLRNLVLRLY